ncbi:MAG: polyprenyl synthetase family protein, partial [Thioalkalispiraceae bacterium]
MKIEEIYVLIEGDMARVNECIKDKLRSDVVLINQVGQYIVHSGGKRLRPVLHLLTANAFQYKGDQHIECASLIEFIHTATLLHDDVVDASELRRGQETANALFGNEASVLVGDFLYSRAFQMMVHINKMPVMDILANATNTIAEGEVQQLLNIHDPNTTEASYLQVIHDKTAKLFESATQLAAVLSGQTKQVEDVIARYGMHLGTAFQLVDDILDYGESSGEIGKNVGDDLAEGKPTLPLIYTMRNGSEPQKALMRDVIQHGGRDKFDEVKTALLETG